MSLGTTQHQQHEGLDQKSEVRDVIAHGTHTNPAMQRLQMRVLKSTDASEVITSYDRMHHRHNRS